MSMLEDTDFILVLALIFIVSTFALVVFCSLPCSTHCLARLYNCFVKGRRVEDGSRWHSTHNEMITIPPAPTPRFTYAVSPFTTVSSSLAPIINLSSPLVSQANSIYAINHQGFPIYPFEYADSVSIQPPPSYESLYGNHSSQCSLSSTYTSSSTTLQNESKTTLFVDSCQKSDVDANGLPVQKSFRIKPRAE